MAAKEEKCTKLDIKKYSKEANKLRLYQNRIIIWFCLVLIFIYTFSFRFLYFGELIAKSGHILAGCSLLICSLFMFRKRTMDSGMQKEAVEKHNSGMWRDFLSVVLLLQSLALLRLDGGWSGVIRATPPHHMSVTASNDPSTSYSVEQSTTALPGSALKTLKSWTLLKECIVLLDSLDRPEGEQQCSFCLSFLKSTANVVDMFHEMHHVT